MPSRYLGDFLPLPEEKLLRPERSSREGREGRKVLKGLLQP